MTSRNPFPAGSQIGSNMPLYDFPYENPYQHSCWGTRGRGFQRVLDNLLKEFGLCTLQSSEPWAGAGTEVDPEAPVGSGSRTRPSLQSCYVFNGGWFAGFHALCRSMMLSSPRGTGYFLLVRCSGVSLARTDFNNIYCSGASPATKRAMQMSLMQRGARLLRWLAKISNVVLDVFGLCGSCRFLVCLSSLLCFTCYHLKTPGHLGHHMLFWHTLHGRGRLRIHDCRPSGA